jgi:peptidoglycan/xylan/chitin deacetylase (PgdA/CDA1 family)
MTRLELKRRLGRLGRHIGRSRRRDVVLLYHSVGASPWATRADDFARQMEWLCDNARIVSLDAVLQDQSPEPLRVALTFDDGYASLSRAAASVLRQLHLSATLFVNTAHVRQNERARSQPQLGHYPDEQFLLWREVERLVVDGWSVGSHGVTHLDFTRADDDVVRAQLCRSKADIEQHLGIRCRYFAYTWGRHSRHLQKLVAEEGYERAFTGRHGPMPHRINPMAVPRINVARDYSFDDFKAIIRGDWDYLGWYQRVCSR